MPAPNRTVEGYKYVIGSSERCKLHNMQNKGKPCSIAKCSRPAHCRGWCQMHYTRWQRHGDPLATSIDMSGRAMDDVSRFWHHIRKTRGCWYWTGTDTNTMGHGRLWLSGGERIGAHVFSYVLHYGPIPPGLELDHLCCNPSCVRPDHLEAVTRRENLIRGNSPVGINARKTHCIRGHAFDEANTVISKRGTRACRICANEGKRARRDRAKSNR